MRQQEPLCWQHALCGHRSRLETCPLQLHLAFRTWASVFSLASLPSSELAWSARHPGPGTWPAADCMQLPKHLQNAACTNRLYTLLPTNANAGGCRCDGGHRCLYHVLQTQVEVPSDDRALSNTPSHIQLPPNSPGNCAPYFSAAGPRTLPSPTHPGPSLPPTQHSTA